jgi:hypothetical protein
MRVSQRNHDKLVEIAADLQKQQHGKRSIVSLDEALSFVIKNYEESRPKAVAKQKNEKQLTGAQQ